MTISRTGMGPSLARPIGKVRQKPLKLKSVGIPPGMIPGMKNGGSVKTKGWGVSKMTNKCKSY